MNNVGEVLQEQGLITYEQFAQAVAARKGPADRIERVLVDLGFVKEDDILNVWADQLALQVVDLSEAEIDVELLRSMPSKLVHSKKLVPLKADNGVLPVATSDPFDVYAFDELRMVTGKKVEAVLAPGPEIQRVINTYCGIGGDTLNKMIGQDDLELISADGSDEDGEDEAQEASVITLVNDILTEAIKERASDVHIEPFENSLHIRYRIDGVLQPASIDPKIQRFQAAIISRIKIMAKLNIAEKRLPQDGSMKLRAAGREVDIRVSIVPMVWGEGIVMRILDKHNADFTLQQLGMTEDIYQDFSRLISQPHGIVLVTGPTGSGKTTTLYAALKEIVSDRIKVLTLEDPVEYRLTGVNQVQIHPRIGLSFAAGLRAFLRHDPDVVMVGEIRDLETAEAAVQASLTGHLVFSTLHTNDAASANTRLLDMGVEPFLVSSSIEGVMAQRLLRTICSQCKEKYEPDPAQLPPDFAFNGEKLFRGRGCRNCRNTGYAGRLGIYELFAMGEEARDLVMQRATTGRLLTYARANGMRTLREDGWTKVRDGITTPEEVVRVSKDLGSTE
jgi:general secretion pathway protein E/type IV pilus assembly protein PilB